MMNRSVGCAVLLLLSAPAAAAPDPIVQVNYPVIALGETETLRLQLSAHPGGLPGALVTYSIHMNRLDSGHSSGYRVLEVRCPPEFLSNVYSGHAGAVCYRESGTPHAAGRMEVTVFNEDAPDGHLQWDDGLRSLDRSAPPVKAAWHLFGVRP